MRVLLAVVLGLLAASPVPAAEVGDAARIEQGRYLAILGDCAPCHTASGGAPYAGGRPIATPFGTLLTPNITPDPETGIGGMRDEEFVSALKSGIGRDGRHLYPAMPYPYYTLMTVDDALALRRYLATLPAVKNVVVVNQLPFPFDVRAVMRVWNSLYFDKGEFRPDAAKSAEWNRGAWLVEGPGHCGACHTPKTKLGGDETAKLFQGGVIGGWLAPNLTGDARIGLGAWSAEDIVTYLRAGVNRHTSASGPMVEVITESTAHMTDADLAAIAMYVKDQPAAGGGAVMVAGDPHAMAAGQAIYQDNCTSCHGPNGEGVAGLFPALRGNAVLQSSPAHNAIQMILHGGQAPATERAPTGLAMPGFAWKLNDDQIAAVTTYIRDSWGNAAAPVEARAVHGFRENPR